MCAWGGCGFLRDEQVVVRFDDEGIWMCAPTVGEIGEEFGFGIAARKVSCLFVASVGTVLGLGSGFSLVMKTQKT
jgi:hypothetical protein